jgi:hypothetical protein
MGSWYQCETPLSYKDRRGRRKGYSFFLSLPTTNLHEFCHHWVTTFPLKSHSFLLACFRGGYIPVSLKGNVVHLMEGILIYCI